MKLAAAFSARHGRSTVALIGADRDRLGTERELLDRAASLGIYTLAVGGKESLRSALADVSDRRLVIVDTAGLGHRDPRLSEQAQFISDFPELTAFLVLAAPAQRSTLEATIRRYGALNPRGCVLTKLDETASLGEALTALTHCGLPSRSAPMDRARIREALHLPRPKSLVARMAALAEEGAEIAPPSRVKRVWIWSSPWPRSPSPQELNYA